MTEKKLFLLDAYALIYRAYYALVRSPRVTSYGFNTSAIFGFCNTLEDILRKENPDYIGVCFDPPGGQTFRHEVYPEYKAGRDKQPEDITKSIPYIKRILAAYCIPVVEMEHFEADDVIGTLSRLAEGEGFTTYMMTPDKDYGQLVTDHVFMYRPALKGQGFEIRGPKEVCERYGISSPRQVIDLLALEGDASDNVPGCPGVGEKTAAKLIADWESVENILEHVGDLKGALQKKISGNIEQIRMSKYLVTINTDVPIGFDPDSFRRCAPDREALRRIFEELEFKTMAAKLGVESEPTALRQQATPKSETPSLFDIADEPETAAPVAHVAPMERPLILDTEEGIRIFAGKLGDRKEIAVSLYSTGAEAMTARLFGIAFATAVDEPAVYIVLPEMPGERREVMELLKPVFANPAINIISTDIKRDMLILRREGVEMTDNYFDVSVAHYLIAPEMKHDLPTLANSYLAYKTLDWQASVTERKKDRFLDRQEAAEIYGEAAMLLLQLKPLLSSELAEKGQSQLLTGIELPFVRVLAEMEWTGARIDVAELRRQSVDLTSRLGELEQEAFEIAGHPFNVGSPMQVGQVLFEELKIDPKAKKTKSGSWSTTEEILEKYRREHHIVDLILRIRGLRKLLSTYVDSLPKLINPATGKIHTTYNQTVTATGRISSTNPNLQNIPIRTDDGREIRRAFIPDPGDVMFSADYSQIELRLMAHFSGDPAMVEAFRSGADIHRSTAAKIFHLDDSDVTDNQRRAAKTANFGIIYGISAFGLSERLGIPRSEAKELIEGYMRTYPDVARYMSEAIGHARENGYVSTIMGRKRYLPDINSRNSVVRGYAERNAINAPLQGSAADIIKIAMINIDREIRRRGLRSRMIMQVHDELVFNVCPDELAALQTLVVNLMENAYSARVPLEVSAGVGANWLEAH